MGFVVVLIAMLSFLAGAFSLGASWAAQQHEARYATLFTGLWVVCSAGALTLWIAVIE